jgi:hypothetical protein
MHVKKNVFPYLLGLRWLCRFTALATLLCRDTHVTLIVLNSAEMMKKKGKN